MVKYPLRVNTATFREWLSEFGKRVSKKLYKKLDYDKWRPIYLWSKSGTDWEEIEINVFNCPDMIYIVPRHNDKLSPNGIEIMLHKNSFGDYLIDVMEDYNTVLTCSTSISDTFSTAVDVARGAACDYDACTKLSTHDQHIYNTLQDWQPWAIDLNTDGLRINGDSLEVYIEKTVNKSNNNKKEEENNKMMKFDFGPVDSSVHMSMYGMAIKNASGTYVSYDVANKRLMDVDIVNFEGANKFMYKIPAAMKDIAIGDIVVHARKPMFVTEITPEGKLIVIDPTAGEEKTIMLAHSPFGFNFVTKVVSLLNFGGADKDNPFGNMLPFILLSDSNNKDNDALLMMALMGNGTNSFANNPMMLWALMGNHTNDPMMLALMMSQCGFGAQPSGCNGNCHCHDEK